MPSRHLLPDHHLDQSLSRITLKPLNHPPPFRQPLLPVVLRPSRLVEVELWEELTFVSDLQVEDIVANAFL